MELSLLLLPLLLPAAAALLHEGRGRLRARRLPRQVHRGRGVSHPRQGRAGDQGVERRADGGRRQELEKERRSADRGKEINPSMLSGSGSEI